jgi:hypothetical protein
MTRIISRPWLVGVPMALAAAFFLSPLAAEPQGFPFAPGASYSDALIAHLSSALFLHRAVATWGQLPLWNPTILSGLPFAADPLSGLWYPPIWLMAIFPGAPAINLLFWIHLVLGAAGMFLLLRSEGLPPLSALTGGLAFAGMPKLVGHVGLGHLSLVSAVCWSPWVLFSAARAVDGAGRPRSLRAFLLAGALVGVVFLADPRWFVPVGLVAVGYGLWRWRTLPPEYRLQSSALLKGAAAAGVALVAVGAAFALPLAEFVGLTTRQTITPAADVYSFPVSQLLGLLVASPGAWAEWIVSMGSVALVLAVAGLAAWPRRGLFWAVLLALALILAFGRNTPLGALFSGLPGIDLMRVPARWLFFAGMAIAALAAHGLSAVEAKAEGPPSRRIRVATLFAGAVVVAVNVAVAALSGSRPGASGLFAILAVAGIWLGLKAARLRWAAPALTVLLVLELISIDISLVESRPAHLARGKGRALAASLAQEDGQRVFSPSYAVPQDAAAEAGLELADGVHPLQLASYVEFMASAVGFDGDSYSVTLPPFPSGDPAVDWGPSLDAEALGWIGVDRIVSTYPIDAAGISLESETGGVLLYGNAAARPRAWVEGPTSGGTSLSPAASIERAPNWVEVRATGPGTLVLGDPMYPGWRASLDGSDVPIEPYLGLLRAVALPPGDHTVRFSFVPLSLVAGLGLALIAAFSAAAIWRRA